jgi:hypothetical protein
LASTLICTLNPPESPFEIYNRTPGKAYVSKGDEP